MPELFYAVKPENSVRVTVESLLRAVTAIFEKMGESPEDAALGAYHLVMTDLRGMESQGVSNRLTGDEAGYVRQYKEGIIKPRANWRIVRETPSTAKIDGDRGVSVILGAKAMELAIDKARNVGVGVVTIFNGGDSGGLGQYAMQAAREDMVGMCMTASGGGKHSAVPTFGAEARLGTNPIAFAAPAGNEPPVLFDASTTAIAGSKITLAERLGVPLLAGAVADRDGTPIMEDRLVREGEYAQLPLGSTRESGSHKGYGLGLIVEILSTMLSGALPCMVDVASGRKHYFAAYDIAAFTDVATFKANMDKMLKTLRQTQPAPGHDQVVYPGLMAHAEEQRRRVNGIPLHTTVIKWFEDISDELSVPRLAHV